MSGFHLGSTLAAVALHAAASGGTYRWVDAQGAVHYGDQPPSGVVAVTVPPSLPAGSGEEQNQLQLLSQQRSQEEAEQAKKQEEVSKQRQRDESRKAACTDAQALRERLERPRQLVNFPDGSACRLDEEERQSRIRETDARITESCTDGP